MENTALIIGSLSISYSGLVLCLAALSGCCAFFGLQRSRKKNLFPAISVMLPGMLLSLPLSRLIHWYSNTSQYPSFLSALTDYTTGGFVVLGAFAAFLLSALLMYALGAVKNLPALLDDLICAGSLSLAVGKLACLYSAVCRSKFTLASESFHCLPFMVSSTLNNGSIEWRIATFCLQSIAYALIFVFAFALIRKKLRPGVSFALTLSLIGAVQVVLDSTRYDAAYFRSNGFVSITQICCVVALLAIMIVFSVLSVKRGGLRKIHFVYWLLWAAFAGVGGYCEYYVQRHADTFLTTYALMESCFLGTFILNCLLARMTDRVRKSKSAPIAPEGEVKAEDEMPVEDAEPVLDAPEETSEAVGPESDAPEEIPEAVEPEIDAPEEIPEAVEPESDVPEEVPEAVEPEIDAPEEIPVAVEPQSDTPEEIPEEVEPEIDTPEEIPEAVEPEVETPAEPAPEVKADAPADRKGTVMELSFSADETEKEKHETKTVKVPLKAERILSFEKDD